MKCLNEKDYKYLGLQDGWHKFISQPKINFDPEIIMLQRVRYYRCDGSNILLTSVDKCKQVVPVRE